MPRDTAGMESLGAWACCPVPAYGRPNRKTVGRRVDRLLACEGGTMKHRPMKHTRCDVIDPVVIAGTWLFCTGFVVLIIKWLVAAR